MKHLVSGFLFIIKILIYLISLLCVNNQINYLADENAILEMQF